MSTLSFMLLALGYALGAATWPFVVSALGALRRARRRKSRRRAIY